MQVICNPIDERRPTAAIGLVYMGNLYTDKHERVGDTRASISVIPYIFTRVSHRRARVIYANTRENGRRVKIYSPLGSSIRRWNELSLAIAYLHGKLIYVHQPFLCLPGQFRCPEYGRVMFVKCSRFTSLPTLPTATPHRTARCHPVPRRFGNIARRCANTRII